MWSASARLIGRLNSDDDGMGSTSRQKCTSFWSKSFIIYKNWKQHDNHEALVRTSSIYQKNNTVWSMWKVRIVYRCDEHESEIILFSMSNDKFRLFFSSFDNDWWIWWPQSISKCILLLCAPSHRDMVYLFKCVEIRTNEINLNRTHSPQHSQQTQNV